MTNTDKLIAELEAARDKANDNEGHTLKDERNYRDLAVNKMPVVLSMLKEAIEAIKNEIGEYDNPEANCPELIKTLAQIEAIAGGKK